MHSQLSYTAAKLEIVDRQRRAERGLSCERETIGVRSSRRNPIVRLLATRRTTPTSAVEVAPAGRGAA